MTLLKMLIAYLNGNHSERNPPHTYMACDLVFCHLGYLEDQKFELFQGSNKTCKIWWKRL